jgi:hypothetical protein
VSTTAPEGIRATPFAELLATHATGAVDEASARVGPNTVAKLLFTSGSTGMPKGVVNTQRMLCANQEMLRSVFPFLADEPPVLCDWLPWNHTAGGNHNFGLVLWNGGTAAAAPARGRCPARAVLRPAGDLLLRGRRHAAGRARRAPGPGRRSARRGAAVGDGHGRHRDGPLYALHGERRRLRGLPACFSTAGSPRTSSSPPARGSTWVRCGAASSRWAKVTCRTSPGRGARPRFRRRARIPQPRASSRAVPGARRERP